MKNPVRLLLSLAMLFGTFNFLLAQDENEDYAMWETILLVPDNTKLKTLSANLRSHNQKYHKEGPYQATVYNIVSGPDTGKLVWLMGPLMFPQLDNRPGEGAHDDDWRDNVMPYIKKVEKGEYWRGDNELSNTSMMTPNPGDYPILFTRYLKVDADHRHMVDGRLKVISETIKAMEGENPWGVYYNLFRQGDLGRHIATVGFFKNWTDFDRDPKFKATFLKSHDDDDWYGFIRSSDQVLEDSWDEIWVYDKNLSGN